MKRFTVKKFSLQKTLECGQSFCWTREGEGYINADVGGVIYVEQREDRLYYESTHNNIDLCHLLGLNDPIKEIQQQLRKDQFIDKCINFGDGLRVVRDPFFPCLVSFLCSIRKNIPAIEKMTRRIRDT